MATERPPFEVMFPVVQKYLLQWGIELKLEGTPETGTMWVMADLEDLARLKREKPSIYMRIIGHCTNVVILPAERSDGH